jgi:high-affinity iron transporter
MKLILYLVLFVSLVSWGAESKEVPRSLIHLLNYIAADYSGAVKNGAVISVSEYNEQTEFSRTVVELVEQEEKFRLNPAIQQGVVRLNQLVLDKKSAEEIRTTAVLVQGEVLKVSGLRQSPQKWPNLKHGKEMFSKQCAQCHGGTGHGDGPSSGNFDPKPANFFEAKYDFKSPFQFFNAIRLGVPGTAMAAFDTLSDNDTWDLAFYVSSLKHEGKNPGAGLTHPWTLDQVASLSDYDLLKSSAQNPESVKEALSLARTFDLKEENQGHLLTLTKENLEVSLAAFRLNNFELAKTKAVAAYLDGIEPLEPKLRLNDPNFTVKLEESLASFRKQIDQRASIEDLYKNFEAIQAELAQAKKILESQPSSFGMTFSVAGGIFLREALEAALLIITLVGVVRTIGNAKALFYIHAGWILAFLVGLISWFFSGWVMGISGLRRELLEGTISLLAVVVLLYFGFWLHRKTEIGKWRAFINDLVKSALDNKKMLGLAIVSFMGVFREAFETVLFLRALLIESPGQEFALGLGVLSAFALVLVASNMAVRYSAKLPLKQLFSFSSMVMLFLAFVLIGKSVHAFQEAGIFSSTTIAGMPRIDGLGFFPTCENVIPQLLLLLLAFSLWVKPKFKEIFRQPVSH